MIRWICLVLGIASLALGVTGYLMHPPIPVVPEEMTVAQAVNALDHHDRIAVTLRGKLDREHPIYSSVCKRPVFASLPPSKTHDVGDPNALEPGALDAYLGACVSIDAELGSGQISAQIISSNADDGDEIRGQRILAPVVGSDRLWVVSPMLEAGDPQAFTFSGRRSVEGALTEFRHLDTNVGSYRLAMDLEEIRRVAETDVGHPITDDALVLISEGCSKRSDRLRLPIAGSGDALFATPLSAEVLATENLESVPIEGLMWVWYSDDDAAEDLAHIVGHPMPVRYGVIHLDETAEDHNRKTTFGLRLFAGIGGVLIALAALIFLIRRLRA